MALDLKGVIHLYLYKHTVYMHFSWFELYSYDSFSNSKRISIIYKLGLLCTKLQNIVSKPTVYFTHHTMNQQL